MSGKTTLARKMAEKTRNSGRGVMVLDPLLSDWPCDAKTNDPDNFLKIAKQNKNLTLIIDEAGEYCGQYAKQMWWLATQARHWGHKSIFLSQRATMVARNIRDNCSSLFCFRVSPADADTLADDFCFQGLKDAPALPQGVCFWAPRYGELKKINVFD
jgi:hypothetical protein